MTSLPGDDNRQPGWRTTAPAGQKVWHLSMNPSDLEELLKQVSDH